MESCKDIILHPQLVDILFAYKSKAVTVFRDVLGLHDIDHIAITRVNPQRQMVVLSSTPAMEYNLFSSSLWRYDCSYASNWFQQGVGDYWPNLYQQARYDELYYLKQIKHEYPIGLSLARSWQGGYVIYSLASSRSCCATQDLFAAEREQFYQIGHYCLNRLSAVWNECDAMLLPQPSMAGIYELST